MAQFLFPGLWASCVTRYKKDVDTVLKVWDTQWLIVNMNAVQYTKGIRYDLVYLKNQIPHLSSHFG